MQPFFQDVIINHNFLDISNISIGNLLSQRPNPFVTIKLMLLHLESCYKNAKEKSYVTDTFIDPILAEYIPYLSKNYTLPMPADLAREIDPTTFKPNLLSQVITTFAPFASNRQHQKCIDVIIEELGKKQQIEIVKGLYDTIMLADGLLSLVPYLSSSNLDYLFKYFYPILKNINVMFIGFQAEKIAQFGVLLAEDKQLKLLRIFLQNLSQDISIALGIFILRQKIYSKYTIKAGSPEYAYYTSFNPIPLRQVSNTKEDLQEEVEYVLDEITVIARSAAFIINGCDTSKKLSLVIPAFLPYCSKEQLEFFISQYCLVTVYAPKVAFAIMPYLTVDERVKLIDNNMDIWRQVLARGVFCNFTDTNLLKDFLIEHKNKLKFARRNLENYIESIKSSLFFYRHNRGSKYYYNRALCLLPFFNEKEQKELLALLERDFLDNSNESETTSLVIFELAVITQEEKLDLINKLLAKCANCANNTSILNTITCIKAALKLGVTPDKLNFSFSDCIKTASAPYRVTLHTSVDSKAEMIFELYKELLPYANASEHLEILEEICNVLKKSLYSQPILLLHFADVLSKLRCCQSGYTRMLDILLAKDGLNSLLIPLAPYLSKDNKQRVISALTFTANLHFISQHLKYINLVQILTIYTAFSSQSTLDEQINFPLARKVQNLISFGMQFFIPKLPLLILAKDEGLVVQNDMEKYAYHQSNLSVCDCQANMQGLIKRICYSGLENRYSFFNDHNLTAPRSINTPEARKLTLYLTQKEAYHARCYLKSIFPADFFAAEDDIKSFREQWLGFIQKTLNFSKDQSSNTAACCVIA